MSEKEFVDGLIVKPPHEKAPDFVKCGISIKVKHLGNFLREKNKAGEEWVNIQVKTSKNGKWYAEVDNWKPDKKEATKDDFDDDIPF